MQVFGIEAYQIAPVEIPVDEHLAAIDELALHPLLGVIGMLHRHRDLSIRGQKREHGIAHLHDGHLSVFVLHQHQVGIRSLLLVADEAEVGTYPRHSQRVPGFQQRHAERCSPQTVDHHGIKPDTSVVVPTHHHRITVGYAEDEGKGALLQGLVNSLRNPASRIKEFNAVVSIPVAGNHHPDTIYRQGSRDCSFPVKTAKAFEAMSRGVITLHRERLSDSQRFVVTSTDEHLAGW